MKRDLEIGPLEDLPEHIKTYRLERARFQSANRAFVIARDGRCLLCGATDDLQAAHLRPVAELRSDFDMRACHDPRLQVTLCKSCHQFLDGRCVSEAHRPELEELLQRRNDARRSLEERFIDPVVKRSLERREALLTKRIREVMAKQEEIREEARAQLERYLLAREPNVDENGGWAVLMRLVAVDFFRRVQMWHVPYEHRAVPKRAGFHWSRYFNGWYASPSTKVPPAMKKHGRRASSIEAHEYDRQERLVEFRRKKAQERLAKQNERIRGFEVRFEVILKFLLDSPRRIDEMTAHCKRLGFPGVPWVLTSGHDTLISRGFVVKSPHAPTYEITSDGRVWLETRLRK